MALLSWMGMLTLWPLAALVLLHGVLIDDQDPAGPPFEHLVDIAPGRENVTYVATFRQIAQWSDIGSV